MDEIKIDHELIQKFEKGLDPLFPERSKIPPKILGYGEMSTVMEIDSGNGGNLAYKRMPMFETETEAIDYEALYRESIQVFKDKIGLNVSPSDIVRIVDEDKNRVIIYIAQEKLNPETIANNIIHNTSPKEARKLVLAVLKNMKKVFDYNKKHKGELEIGLDGQISNWAVTNFHPDSPDVYDNPELVFFDTSTPLMRKDGEEQLDPELLLRSAPSFLTWILRLFFLEDVMTRYYDFRKVVIDLIANLYKEQREDLVQGLVETVNEIITADNLIDDYKPITVAEVKSYYREDAWIWRIYLGLRRVDRSLHRLFKKDYPYLLPGKVKR